VQSIRDLQLPMVVVLALLLDPRLLHQRQRCPPISVAERVRDRLRRELFRIEYPRVALVEEHLIQRRRPGPCPQPVAGLGSHGREDVGAHVPAAQGVQVPVCFDGGDLGVMVVVVFVDGAG